MNTTSSTILAAMAAVLGGSMVLEGVTGLPLLFALATIIGVIAVAFGAGVVATALFFPSRRPVSMRRVRVRVTS